MPRGELILLRFAESPYAEGMLLAGIVGIPVALLSIAISFGSLSSINPCIASPARGLFSMSRDGIFPHWFDVLHGRFRTPFIAILLIGGVSIMLISSGSIVYIASISLFAELFFYVLAFASSISLRKKYPDLERPYRCPHLMVGAPILILAYFILMSQLERDAMITGLVWLAIGIIIYEIWIHTKTGKKSVEDAKESFNRIEQRLPLLPDQETKRKLDRTYKLWKIGIAIIFLFVVFLFILPRLLNL
jgi:APA family basic amino acid/polyamine antiporter